MALVPLTDPIPLLNRFYEADDHEADRLLTQILEQHVRPLVGSIVSKRLGDAGFAATSGGTARMQTDIEDVEQEAILRIAQRLLGARKGEEQVGSLKAYATTTADHACDEFYRKCFRRRYNVTKRVCVHLREHEAFVEYRPSINVRMASLSAWPVPPPQALPERVHRVLRDAAEAIEEMFREVPDTDKESAPSGKAYIPGTVRCMWTGLTWCRGALLLDCLVTVVQAARNEFDEMTSRLPEEDHLGLAVPPPEFEAGDVDGLLRAVWKEVQSLPRRQAQALLLNLRVVGDTGVELFAVQGVARLDEIAAAVGIPADQFVKEVLPTLPWPDRRVAEFIGCREEQVCGLRSVARRRLSARLGRSSSDWSFSWSDQEDHPI